jgi:heme oxygenase (biliverdin-producing, ferredoxin)
VRSALEDGIEKYKENPVLAPTYRPDVLGRAEPLSLDISYILGVQTPDWRAHPIHVQLEKAFPKPLTTYVNRLRHLGADGADSRLLLAHAYVRYLGDLSGGQIIRKRIAKSYEFPKNGNGVRFYVFHEGKGEPEAGPSEMKALKVWFRAGMDAGVGDDEKLKGKWTSL